MRSLFKKGLVCWMVGFVMLSTAAFQPSRAPSLQTTDPAPPDRVVKLIFIHHSTGENWLADGYGNLGRVLGENNYFVSDTNYGWGPRGIGDRTDIPDWLEWFSSPNTETYLEALFQERNQQADYTRAAGDPGGENEIILFKSCFPNSDLTGDPDDPPSAEGGLSVGHAKYVYTEILKFFERHPEKLFIVITAPPLSDPGNAANARAFNQWLVHDWLAENTYPYQNVAVFDFYNILTGPEGHHTVENGQVVHQPARMNTLYYPSEDDHPSAAGSQKATDEFIPLLNYYYHRWQEEAPGLFQDQQGNNREEEEGAAQLPQEPAAVQPAIIGGSIDTFEGELPVGSNGWEAYWDEGTSSSLACWLDPNAGIRGGALRLDYQITPNSWGTCGLTFHPVQDWSETAGLGFSIRSQQTGQVLHVDLYVEDAAGQESYLAELPLTAAMQQEWVQVSLSWDQFQRVAWEEGAGDPFLKSDRVSGLAFGFGAEEELAGVLWIDELSWLNRQKPVEVDPGGPQDRSGELPAEEAPGSPGIPCLGSLVLPLGLVGVGLWRKKSSRGSTDQLKQENCLSIRNPASKGSESSPSS